MKRHRFVSGRNETTSFHVALCTKSISPVLPFQFAEVFGGGGGGGGGGGREGRAGGRSLPSEISPLTAVDSAAGDELFGPTRERGNGGL